MCVVGRGGDGDGPGAPDVGVAQLVGQLLQLVSVEMVIIPEDVIVAGTRCSLDTCNESVSLQCYSDIECGMLR